MFVDGTPVRVLKNLTATVLGYQFPSKPAMLIRGSLWDGSSWATDGGRTKVDWSKGPFTTAFRGFDVGAACAVGGVTPSCYSAAQSGRREYKALSAAHRAAYEGVKKKNMVYDYCTDKLRFKNHVPLECSYH